MELNNLAAIGSLIVALPQGLAASIQVVEWLKGKPAKVKLGFGRKALAIILTIGSAAAVGFGVWLIDHPLKPIEKTVYVEKVVPCPVPPPAKSGNATTRGANSPAVSGSGNTFSTAPASRPADKP
jgi:hypothetical protein